MSDKIATGAVDIRGNERLVVVVERSVGVTWMEIRGRLPLGVWSGHISDLQVDDVARLHSSPFSIPGFRSSFIPYRSRRGSKAVVLVILDAHVDLNHRSTRRSAQADADFVAPAQSIECMFVTVRNVFLLLCDDLPGIEAYGVGEWHDPIPGFFGRKDY